MDRQLWFANIDDLMAYQAGNLTEAEARERYRAWIESGGGDVNQPDGSVRYESGFTINSYGMIETHAVGGNHDLLWGESDEND